MEKTYQKPSIEVVEGCTEIICTSPSTLKLFNGNDAVDSEADYDFEAL